MIKDKTHKLIINDVEWEMKFVTTDEIPCKQEGHSVFGCCLIKELTIYVDKTLPADLIFFTLKHELTHAFVFSHALEQVEKNDEILADFVALFSDRILEFATFFMNELGKNYV